MDRSAAFTAAHALTRRTIQPGDSYAVTFGACLRAVLRGETAPTREERAERIAELIEEDGAFGARVWIGRERGVVRVYLTRGLSRGRRQDAGYVEVAEDGRLIIAAERRRAHVRDLLAAA